MKYIFMLFLYFKTLVKSLFSPIEQMITNEMGTAKDKRKLWRMESMKKISLMNSDKLKSRLGKFPD